jgi:hypothetical protein
LPDITLSVSGIGLLMVGQWFDRWSVIVFEHVKIDGIMIQWMRSQITFGKRRIHQGCPFTKI